MEQHIAELSAIINTITQFIDNCTDSDEDCENIKNKIIKKFANSAIIYDDTKNVFYRININDNNDIFLCDSVDIPIELLWAAFGDACCGNINNNWLIPVSVLVSVHNRYLMYKFVYEHLLSLFIIDPDDKDTDITLPITITQLDHDSSIAMCDGINNIYSMHSLLVSICNTNMISYTDTNKYYNIDEYVTLTKLIDNVHMHTISVGLSCDHFEFSVNVPVDAMCIEVSPNDITSIISISRQNIDCTISNDDIITELLNTFQDDEFEYDDDINDDDDDDI